MATLKVENLQVFYGGIRALRGLSFNVQDNEIVSLIGANGAGKSTTLKVIMGQVEKNGGRVIFNNENIENLDTTARVKAGLCLVPESRKIFANLTVKENLVLGGYMHRDHALVLQKIAEYLELFPRLKDKMAQKGGTLSGGEQQMLAIARALMSLPKLIMMDEPSLGIAPKITDEIFDKILDLRKNGISVLLVEQNASEALKISDRSYVLDTGTVVLTGTGKEVAENDLVKKTYLGG